MIEEVRRKVEEILGSDNSGHGMEHVDRVLKMTIKFAEKENANIEIASLIALLHDVDDYKLFGIDSANNLTNTRKILDECGINDKVKKQVIEEVSCIGYSKYLSGIRPKTIEGMIASDADMCDALGVTGILRSYRYNIKHNNKFFDKDLFPIENISAEEYKIKTTVTVVTHMFEKLLKLKDIMMTNSGYQEASKRHDFMISFLHQFFMEEDNLEWDLYLNNYVKKK